MHDNGHGISHGHDHDHDHEHEHEHPHRHAHAHGYWHGRTIGEVVAELPAAAEIFESNGIDFCCGGHRSLFDVINEMKLDGHAIYHDLDEAREKAERDLSTEDLRKMDAAELTEVIETRHHTYMHEALPRIGQLASRVLKAHGQNHPELFRVHALYGALRTELEQHLVKEEIVLFPLMSRGEPVSAYVSVVRELRAEHESAGKVLKELRAITGGFSTPADACSTYRRFYDELDAMEGDLFRHIHLENNLLFKDIE